MTELGGLDRTAKMHQLPDLAIINVRRRVCATIEPNHPRPNGPALSR